MIEYYYIKRDITNFAAMLTTLAVAMLAYYSLFSYHGVI